MDRRKNNGMGLNPPLPAPMALSLGSLLALAVLLLHLTLAFALEVPQLRGPVNDYAGVFQRDQLPPLETHLAQIERDTGHQVAVLTIPTLEGEDIEGFSIRVAESWKIGKQGFDNGVILVVAIKDRRLRFEIGYGLEGLVPDAIAKRIISDYIVPRFRQQDYAGGILLGIAALDKILRKEPLPESARKTPRGSSGLNSFAMLAITLGMLGVMGFSGVTHRRRRGLLGTRGPSIWYGSGGLGRGGFGGGGFGGGFSGGGGGFGGGGASGSW